MKSSVVREHVGKASAAAAAAVLVLVAAVTSAPGGAVAAPRWAPVDAATITPGVQMMTLGSQCTGSFVFTDRRERVYVGYAAHCAGAGDVSDTQGCINPSLPLGTPVEFVRGETLVTSGPRLGQGALAYSSWLTMQEIGTKNPAVCEFNDFALVRVSKADRHKVNPSVPHWGGPTGLRAAGLSEGDKVYSYGNSLLRAGITETSPKVGTSVFDHPSGWSHNIYTLTPGVFGDSGSGYLDDDGRAFGTMSTVELALVPGRSGVSDLAHALAFARKHSGISGLRLVKGTEPFVGLG